MSASARLEAIVCELKASRKYRHLCEATLNRVGQWAQARYPNRKLAVKNAKSKLHQVYGAFVEKVDFTRLQTLTDCLAEQNLRITCNEILGCHTSTAERMPFVEELYATLFGKTGYPGRLLDLACGLNPFSLPWMNLPSGSKYEACDIDSRLVAAIDRLFAHSGVDGTAKCQDLLVGEQSYQADVVLLLKTLPSIEQQEKGMSLRLLRRMHADHIVVSYPSRSIGGRAKGMPEHYESIAKSLAEDLGRKLEKLTFPGEIFYLMS